MRNLFQEIKKHLSAQEALVLVTITATSGATPRGAGAHMLVGRGGRICGTIGGGAVEYHSEQFALQVLENQTSAEQIFSLNKEDIQNLGMICGGSVQVFFHYIPAGNRDVLALADEAEKQFQSGEALWLLSKIGENGSLSLYTHKDGILGSPCPKELLPHLGRRAKIITIEKTSYCVEQINSPGRVYIFGGGHVSQELEPILTHVGFRCVVMDDRPEFANRELFPTAEDVRLIDFNRISDYITLTAEDYVCIMTRGHSYDTVLQAQVLKCAPCYVGVIGSRSKAASVREALKEDFGLTDPELDLVTTPIGLSIAAETPAEIAISIAGQMIQLRARRNNE